MPPKRLRNSERVGAGVISALHFCSWQPGGVHIHAPASVAPQLVAPAKTLPGNSNKFRHVFIQMQSGLTAYGEYAGALTGVVDAEMRAALGEMQKDNNLKTTGTITTEVQDAFGIVAR
jgi:hypothetical protein